MTTEMKKPLIILTTLLLVGGGCAKPYAAPQQVEEPQAGTEEKVEAFTAPEAPEGWTRLTSPLGVTFIYPNRASSYLDDTVSVTTAGSKISLFGSKNPSFTHDVIVEHAAPGQSIEEYLQSRMTDEARAAGCAYEKRTAAPSPSGRRIDEYVMRDPTGGGALSPCPGNVIGRTISSPDVPGTVVFVGIGQDTFMDPGAAEFMASVEPTPPTP